MNKPAFNILLVEDSPSDAFLIAQALKDTNQPLEIQNVSDGDEALDFLRQKPPYADAPRPDLILLDWNMPRKDGREFLAELKADKELLCIPVIVLTSSRAEQDIATAYRHHANCYVPKPADYKHFKQVLRSIESFWFTNVAFPSKESESRASSASL